MITDTIAQVKNISIDDYLQASYRLSGNVSGKNIFFLCPIHKEKSPSFSVYDNGRKWHCFGACSKGGDIIDLVREIDKLDISEAIEKLCQYAGIKSSYKTSPYIGINKIANILYHSLIDKNIPLVSTFIRKRNISKDVIEHFEIGSTPFGIDDLITQRLLKKYAKSDLIMAGISKEKRGKLVDTHNNGLIIPLKNKNGIIVGFTLFPLPRAVGKPKHVNSPNSFFFVKKDLLYNLNHAKYSESLIFVEGYNDLWSIWQQGVKNVVATMGTITYEQIRQIPSTVKNIYLAFDNNKAGFTYTEKFLELLPRGFHLTPANVFVVGYNGDDPDEFVRSGGVWNDAMGSAETSISWLLKRQSYKNVSELLSKLAIYFSKLRPVEYDEYVQCVFDHIGNSSIRTSSIREQLKEEINKLNTKQYAYNSKFGVEEYVLCSYVMIPHLLKVSPPNYVGGLKIQDPTDVFSSTRHIEIYNSCYQDGSFIGQNVSEEYGLREYLHKLLDGYDKYLDECLFNADESELKNDVETCVARLKQERITEVLNKKRELAI